MMVEKDLLATAVDMAISSGKILKNGFQSHFKIRNKEGLHNLVTEFDLISEKHIISTIEKKYPSHSILSEEIGAINKSSDTIRWIIDPLDGTVNFAHSLPHFAVSIAAQKNKETILGVIYIPLMDELFTVEKGKGAFLNGKPIEVSKTNQLKKAIIATGFPYTFDNAKDNCVEHFNNIVKLGIPIRNMGAAVIDFAYVAAGRYDGFWEMDLRPWDCAAGILLIEEAKGHITNWSGDKLYLSDYNKVIATNKHIHDEFLTKF